MPKKSVLEKALQLVGKKQEPTDSYTSFARYHTIMTYLGKNIIPKLKKTKKKIIVHDLGLGVGGQDTNALLESVGNKPFPLDPATEPYEIAHQLEKRGVDYAIYAVDIDPEAVKLSKKLKRIADNYGSFKTEKYKENSFRPFRELRKWLLDRKTAHVSGVYISTWAKRRAFKNYVNDFFPEHQHETEDKLELGIPEHVKKKIHFDVADISSSSSAKKADIVFFANVFQHLPEESAEISLANISSSMNKGGYLFLDIGNYKKDISLNPYGLKKVKEFRPGEHLIRKIDDRPYEAMLKHAIRPRKP